MATNCQVCRRVNEAGTYLTELNCENLRHSICGHVREMCAPHDLFEKHFPNLLQSYASQAGQNSATAYEGDHVGDYWRRVMKALKKDVGFLRTSENLGRKKDPAHFTMVAD